MKDYHKIPPPPHPVVISTNPDCRFAADSAGPM